jgi:hypothetical protein
VFLIASIVAVVAIETRHPEWCDREYQVRREYLNERVAEHPDRPVMLFIGSSRTVVSFMPERLPQMRTPEGREPIIFNYSHFGAGPKMNLMQIHRALRDGIHPKWVVLELVPGFLAHDDLPYKDMAFADIPVVYPYSNGPRLIAQSARIRVGGVYRTRTALLRSELPEFVTQSAGDREVTLHPLGGDNQFGRLDDLDQRGRDHLTGLAVGRFKARMMTYTINPANAQAMDDLVAFCQSQGMQVALVLTPEDSRYFDWQKLGMDEMSTRLIRAARAAFQAPLMELPESVIEELSKRYPGAEAMITRYSDELRTKFQIPVVDARRWIKDEGFTDPHHLNTRGAIEFTDRLERELLRGMVEGKK